MPQILDAFWDSGATDHLASCGFLFGSASDFLALMRLLSTQPPAFQYPHPPLKKIFFGHALLALPLFSLFLAALFMT